jgi:hypothetical protein
VAGDRCDQPLELAAANNTSLRPKDLLARPPARADALDKIQIDGAGPFSRGRTSDRCPRQNNKNQSNKSILAKMFHYTPARQKTPPQKINDLHPLLPIRTRLTVQVGHYYTAMLA